MNLSTRPPSPDAGSTPAPPPGDGPALGPVPSGAAPGSRSASGTYAPTGFDRAVERVRRAAPVLTRLSDGVLVAIMVVITLLDVLAVGSIGLYDSPYHHVWTLATVGLSFVAVGAVAVRRSHLALAMTVLAGASIGLTVASMALGLQMIPSFAALFGLSLLTARALRVESSSTATACVLLGAVAVAAEGLRPMENGPVAVTLIVMLEACFGVAVAGGSYLRWVEWRRVAAAESARQDERLEIARELHDLVGHYVTGIIVQAQAARHVAPQHPEAAVDALERIELAGGQAMASMRRMVGGLRDDTPTAPGASWDDVRIVVDTAAAEGMPVRLQIDPEVLGASGDLALSAHRIVSESLTNVRRHARDVTQVDVQLDTDRGLAGTGGAARLVVSVTDDGLPAMVTAHDTYGLVGMHERAEALGGSLYAGPGPSGGWLVRAELPMGAGSVSSSGGSTSGGSGRGATAVAPDGGTSS